jgi:hypothetical protein
MHGFIGGSATDIAYTLAVEVCSRIRAVLPHKPLFPDGPVDLTPADYLRLHRRLRDGRFPTDSQAREIRLAIDQEEGRAILHLTQALQVEFLVAVPATSTTPSRRPNLIEQFPMATWLDDAVSRLDAIAEDHDLWATLHLLAEDMWRETSVASLSARGASMYRHADAREARQRRSLPPPALRAGPQDAAELAGALIQRLNERGGAAADVIDRLGLDSTPLRQWLRAASGTGQQGATALGLWFDVLDLLNRGRALAHDRSLMRPAPSPGQSGGPDSLREQSLPSAKFPEWDPQSILPLVVRCARELREALRPCPSYDERLLHDMQWLGSTWLSQLCVSLRDLRLSTTVATSAGGLPGPFRGPPVVRRALADLQSCCDRLPHLGGVDSLEAAEQLRSLRRLLGGAASRLEKALEGPSPRRRRADAGSPPHEPIKAQALAPGPQAHQSAKMPSQDAITVFRYWMVTGKKQTELANDPGLMKLLHRKVDQGTISRMLKRVKEWTKAGNVLPEQTQALNSKPAPINPERLDLGERQDGRAKRQRGRRTSDRDD